MNDVRFQEGSVTSRTIYLLRQTFAGPLIGRNGDVNWPLQQATTIFCGVPLKESIMQKNQRQLSI